MTCCHGVTGAGRTMLYPLSICVTPTHQRSRSYYDPTVCRRGHKRLIGTVAASTPNDRRVIPDLTPSGASDSCSLFSSRDFSAPYRPWTAAYYFDSPPKSAAISRNCSRAASRSSTISWASTSGSGRLSDSSRLSSLSQKISRLALSRLMSSS
jgi:hypothetical protein